MRMTKGLRWWNVRYMLTFTRSKTIATIARQTTLTLRYKLATIAAPICSTYWRPEGVSSSWGRASCIARIGFSSLLVLPPRYSRLTRAAGKQRVHKRRNQEQSPGECNQQEDQGQEEDGERCSIVRRRM